MSTNQYTVGNPAANRPVYYPGLIIKQAPSQRKFFEYLFFENKIFSLLMIFLMICQFILFKLFYPYPDFFSDSYSYIFAAYANLDVNIWPIGYSRFLQGFHWFTHSATALNFFQYMFLELACLYLYHTVVYFFATGSKTRTFLCLFLFFNPLNLYIANYVTSDAIFIGLSIIWLSQIIWIIHRPKPLQILVLSIVFFIAFTFRYNAMYYPLIAAAAFILSKQRLWYKIAGIFLGPVLIIPFILFSSNAAQKMTGTAQFPPILGGWQWGNNAMYMRGFIEEDSTKFPTPETAELDRIARRYFSQPSRPQDGLSSYVANFFIRQPEAPLKQYMAAHYTAENDTDQVASWGKSAVVFHDYGLFLIKRHPLAFARYYLLVNLKNYLVPPLEKLEVYNVGQDNMATLAAYWFNYPSTKIKLNVVSKNFQGTLLMVYPVLFLALNIYFLIVFIQFLARGGLRKTSRPYRNTMLVLAAFQLLNAGFSVFANIVVIRYEVFPMFLFAGLAMLLTDYLEALPKPARVQPGNEEHNQGMGVFPGSTSLEANI